MADTDRISGKQSYWTFNGVNVPITKMTPKVTRKLGDSTDNGDYNSAQDMIATTQIPVTYTMEGAMEGRFRKSVVPSALIGNAFTSLSQIPIALGLDASPTLFGHGLCDISDFTCDVPVDDIVNYTCNVKSWGQFTPNS